MNTYIRYSYGLRLQCIILFLFFLWVPFSFSQETSETLGEIEVIKGDTQVEDTRIFVIRSFEFEVTGKTKHFALLYQGDLKEGEILQGEAGLERYLSLKTRVLSNVRTLESVSMEPTRGEPGPDGKIPVDILVRVADSVNIIALPEPKYDSNSGLSLALKGRDYNFLGTLSPLRVDLGYKRDEQDRNSFQFEIGSDTPFLFRGYRWVFNFDHAFDWSVGGDLSYQNVTGLSMEYPWRSTTFTIGFDQYTFVNEKNTDENKILYNLGDVYPGVYGASSVFGSWRIPLGLEVGNYGGLWYVMSLSNRVNYGYGQSLDQARKGFITSFTHTLGFGQVDWIGNLREGVEASILNMCGYNYVTNTWGNLLSVTGAYHKRFGKLLGFSSRLMYRHYFNTPHVTAGDALRGVRNDNLAASYMLSLNLNFPFRLIRFYPSEWFETRKLRLFDFELYVSPFFDMALVRDPIRGRNFSFQEMVYSGGIELIAFSGFWRSVYLRASLGYRMPVSADHGKKWDELYIGLGHFF
jgi:outer membrane protein assembly factor BamA